MRLADLSGPYDLRSLSLAELQALAAEIRQTLVHHLAPRGGHLAPNLGAVEIALAVHGVLNSPVDKLLWDVSHQCYAHKLLTNRLHELPTVRQYGGMAGYTDPRESTHDHFHWGHAGTSISAAVGLARAAATTGCDSRVVAVIGDGALTAGMALEALNHGGDQRLPVVVILNDNGMSIAPNVGSLRAGLQQGAKASQFFGALGWQYSGPVDGHDILALQEALRHALSRREPVVIHAITTKGKGYEPAEQNSRVFHGVGPYDAATGVRPSASGPPTYSEVFGRTLADLAHQDPRILAVTAAMPDGAGLAPMASQMPDRVLDVGIAEQHAVSLCAGLARGGMRPVLAIYSTFFQRGYDQLIHDVALQNLPVLFAVDRAGLVEDGATHHGLFDLAYLRCIPNLVVMAPKDEEELRQMICTGLTLTGPVAIRYPRAKGEGVALSPMVRPVPLGKGELLAEGEDLTLVAIGSMVQPALLAAERLAAQGTSAAVINARFAKPLDAELIRHWAKRTGLVVTLEEACQIGGFGSAVAELVAGEGLECQVERMGVPDRFMAHGDPARLRHDLGLDPKGIVKSCRQALARRRLSHMGEEQIWMVGGGSL